MKPVARPAAVARHLEFRELTPTALRLLLLIVFKHRHEWKSRKQAVQFNTPDFIGRDKRKMYTALDQLCSLRMRHTYFTRGTGELGGDPVQVFHVREFYNLIGGYRVYEQPSAIIDVYLHSEFDRSLNLLTVRPVYDHTQTVNAEAFKLDHWRAVLTLLWAVAHAPRRERADRMLPLSTIKAALDIDEWELMRPYAKQAAMAFPFSLVPVLKKKEVVGVRFDPS